MRFKSTWILLVITVAIVAYFLLVEQPRHRQERESAELATQLTALKRENIQHVILRRAAETLEFTKQGDDWQVAFPVSDKGEDSAINMLVSSAVDAKIERTFAVSDEDLPGFGLGEQPDAILVLQTSNRDTSLTIRIGGHNITKSHFYAQKDTAADVLLLPAGLRRYALWELSEFRDKDVIDFVTENVQKLELASIGRVLTWEKDTENQWVAVSNGDTIRGDDSEITVILRRMRALKAKEFVSDDPAEFETYFPGDNKTIALWLGPERARQSVIFGDKKPDSCFVKLDASDRIVLIDPDILDVFDKTYNDLRDRHLLRFDRGELFMITLETPDTTAKIIRAGAEWAFANPKLGSILQTSMNLLLYKLEGLKFTNVLEERLIDPKSHGFSNPSFQVTLFDWHENIIDRFVCGDESSSIGTRTTTSRSSSVLAEIEQSTLDDLKKAFQDIKKK
ncbi:MAG: DUF4340 domain-containing protein [Candidatus Latescibacteria bacterium]|nr:DUF4340 domain-containing protein [Candidatus Latescibacterota bacterium]NIM20924.1 DUF4340 domain-containing protein [Candidatus Latescibacterota bacterium]NIM65059.1 DUF4340 domain-containing protein [Candidatus Latescibacterota bacterium]NIO01574.1 DUF4340 domain-containing protein [Candidatus Latescibacterota bacterium]NIO28091.1 DUF4340 domain-containing protein [Candidatus Latescibacterota bacterium]